MSRSVLLLLAVIVGCAEKTKQNEGITQEEYAVYSVVSNEFLGHYKSVIIADSTIRQSRFAGTFKFRTQSGEWVDADDWHLLKERWPDLDTRQLRPSFERQNSAKFQIALSPFKSAGQISILHSQDTLRGIDDDIQYEKVFIRFSRAAFNDEGTRSLVYLEFYCGHLCGAGNWYLLSKEGATWRVVKNLETWVS